MRFTSRIRQRVSQKSLVRSVKKQFALILAPACATTSAGAGGWGGLPCGQEEVDGENEAASSRFGGHPSPSLARRLLGALDAFSLPR